MRDFTNLRHLLLAGTLLLATAVASATELPPEITIDRLLVRAEWQVQEGERWAALATLDEVLALVEEHGMAAPDEFWFLHAQAASVAGAHAQAVESATRYLTAAGRDGGHYRAALELLEKSDREVQAMRERQAAREAAERERLPLEASAEAAYRNLRESAAASPGGVGEAFAEALQSGGRGPVMVVIPAGSFRMGCLSNDDKCYENGKPVHEVTILAPFALSVYEVTFAEWDACVVAGGCRGYEPDDLGWGRGSHPVVLVSWDDAQAYASWLSAQTGADYRLPSESEWEYAARAGTVTRYHWGDWIGANHANCAECGSPWGNERTAPVGSFAPNAFGLHDMLGNVWEWVQDCWNVTYKGAPSDGSAWLQGDCNDRVIRGGYWLGFSWSTAVATRSYLILDSQANATGGFRIARRLSP